MERGGEEERELNVCKPPEKDLYISEQQQPLSYTNYTKSSSLHFEFVLTIVCYISGEIFCFHEAPLSNCTAVDQPFTVRGDRICVHI